MKESEVTIRWWARPAVNILAILIWLGAVEPTVERAERFAGWLLKCAAVKVRSFD